MATCLCHIVFLCIPAFFVLHGAALAENLLVNGGFETITSTSGCCDSYPGCHLPNGYGYWRSDESIIVGADLGIQPFTGSHMLRFLSSTPCGPSISFTGCELFQIIDLRQFAPEIASSKGKLVASAQFNRVHIDSQTDTRFLLDLYAYDGPPSSFQAKFSQDELASAISWIDTDSDGSTWQTASVQLCLPAGTFYAAIRIAAAENVFNDSTDPEFDGHFADDVTVEFVRGIKGDVNDDCVVNILDLIRVRNKLGEEVSSSDTWKADINGDGVINILDLVLARNHLGNRCQ